jgi:hypothetical protein
VQFGEERSLRKRSEELLVVTAAPIRFSSIVARDDAARRSAPFGKRVGSNPFGGRAAIEPRLSHNVTDISALLAKRANVIEYSLP